MKILNFLLIIFFSTSLLGFDPLEFDEILFNHVRKVSESDYKKYISELGTVQASEDWKQIIEKVFRKLITVSTQPSFQPIYSVINHSSLNALAFPAGQFIFYNGLFTKIDSEIRQKEKPKTEKEWAILRENYLAPIIAHELSHYYNNHTFKAFKNIILKEKESSVHTNEIIKFDQEIELEADFYGLLLLQKAGYDQEFFVKILKIMNSNYQENLKNGEKINPYFQTHPSPNERLTKVTKDNKLFLLLSSLEKAYADIQMNQNLSNARSVLEKALEEYPNSEEILKADAVALHKIWLETVPLEDQKVKSILDLPSFRDEMISTPEVKKAIVKKIPGELPKFRKAMNAYRKIEINSDFWLLSNFATLLAYSDDPKDEKMAIQLAQKAFQLKKNIHTLNNLGVVFYLCGQKEEAQQIFRASIRFIHENWKSLPQINPNSKGVKFANEWKIFIDKNKIQLEDIEEDIGALLLNLLLVEPELSKQFAINYYKEYDANSIWAIYLEKLSGVKIPKPKKSNSFLHVDSIRPGLSIKDLLEKWEKPTQPALLENGMEAWYYQNKGTKVSLHDGKIVEIYIFNEDGPSLSNQVKIGTKRKEVELLLGTPKKKGSHFVYEKNGNLAVTYDDGIVERIYLFKDKE